MWHNRTHVECGKVHTSMGLDSMNNKFGSLNCSLNTCIVDICLCMSTAICHGSVCLRGEEHGPACACDQSLLSIVVVCCCCCILHFLCHPPCAHWRQEPFFVIELVEAKTVVLLLSPLDAKHGKAKKAFGTAEWQQNQTLLTAKWFHLMFCPMHVFVWSRSKAVRLLEWMWCQQQLCTLWSLMVLQSIGHLAHSQLCSSPPSKSFTWSQEQCQKWSWQQWWQQHSHSVAHLVASSSLVNEKEQVCVFAFVSLMEQAHASRQWKSFCVTVLIC